MKDNDGNGNINGNAAGNDVVADTVNPKCKRCFYFYSCKKSGCLMEVYETKCYDFCSLDEEERNEDCFAQLHRLLEDRADMIERLGEADYWEK